MFLSYSSTDEAWVRRLAEDLKGHGVKVWLDSDEIGPGALFADALAQGIEQSRTVALVISPASMALDSHRYLQPFPGHRDELISRARHLVSLLDRDRQAGRAARAASARGPHGPDARSRAGRPGIQP